LDSGPYPYVDFVGLLVRFLNKNRKYEILSSADKTQFQELRYKNELKQVPFGDITESFDLNWLKSSRYHSSENLVDLLIELDKHLISDVIFVVDQVEDIYTSPFSTDQEYWKKKFFEFLAVFSKSENIKKIKLLLAMRTEYFGRLSMDCRREDPDLFSIGDYYLSDLKEDEISEAMLLPTSEKDILGLGRPLDKYGFKFEEGLINKMIASIKQAPVNATILPVVQVICKQLYDKLKSRKSQIRIIRYADFEKLGLEDQLLFYVEKCILNKLKDHLLREQKSIEISKWEELLSNLTVTHSFGISRTPISIKEFVRLAIDLRVKIDPGEMMVYLSSDRVRILEKTTIINGNNGESIDCITLSHDSIAYALSRWKRVYEGGVNAFELEGPLGGSSRSMKEISATVLFPIGDNESCHNPIPITQLFSIKSDIWDHKVLSFADHMGFFCRLGIKIDFQSLKRRHSDLPYDQLDVILEKSNDEDLNILSLPRELVSTERRDNSIGFAISNVFEGHAIMAFPQTSGLSLYRTLEDRLHALIGRLQGHNILCEDRGFVEFAYAVRDVVCMLYGDLKCNIEDYPGNTKEMFKYFEKNRNDAATGSAPFKAQCARVGAWPIFTSADLRYLAGKLHHEKRISREKMRSLINKSIIHNVWNINVPLSQWRNKLDLIMRLFSVCLFTNEYVVENRNEISDYIFRESETSQEQIDYDLDKNSIAHGFWNSYRFVRPEMYYDTYCHPESEYFHQLTNVYALINVTLKAGLC
jgi:hypothetical protein